MTTSGAASPTPSDIVRPLVRTRQFREFTGEPVSGEVLAAFADVGRWTGSAGNRQPWRFLLITDIATIRRLGEMGVPQTRPLATATAVIAIVLPAGDDRLIADAYDDGRAAERILVAASMLGLGAGIAWVRADVRAAINEVLGIPSDHFVRTLMAVGHPSDAARRPKGAPGSARLPRAETVFGDRWPG
jgi:nitroreductase